MNKLYKKSSKRPSAAMMFICLSLFITKTLSDNPCNTCYTTKAIRGVSNGCNNCEIKWGTLPGGSITADALCLTKNGLSFYVESGRKCVCGKSSGTKVCNDAFEIAGSFFVCEPTPDWEKHRECLFSGGLGAGAFFANPFLGALGLAYSLAYPCGPCALTPCSLVETAPKHQIRIIRNQDDCPTRG